MDAFADCAIGLNDHQLKAGGLMLGGLTAD
jgi:hypothetical protein